jgi:2'-5' RNA ligase
VRLFVALDIPQTVREALIECTAQLSKLCPGAKWVRLETAHITLKFIGEVPPDRTKEIQAMLAEIQGFEPVEMHFAGLGFFPSPKRPRVFWAGIETGPELAQLASALEERVAKFGIERETREFRPHVTLARFGDSLRPKALDPLRDSIAKMGAADFGRTSAREFYLYQSVLHRSGAEYTRLANYFFSGKPS